MTGAQFKAALCELGYSQTEFARCIGVDRGTVNRWTRSDAPVPPYAEVIVTQASALVKLRRRLARYEPAGPP